MSGVTRAWIVGVNRWIAPSASGSRRSESGKLQIVDERGRPLAHDDDELRLDDVQLARQPRRGVGGILRSELEAVRAVYGHRVDVQALQGLQHGLTGAAEERDALLDLRRLRCELQEHDVGERMARADDGHAQLVARRARARPRAR